MMTLDDNKQAIQILVGARIRELRIATGLTVADLARKVGFSQGQMSKLETGKAALSIGTLSSLCDVLDRPLSYLFQKDTEIPRVLGTMATVAGPESRAIAWFSREVERLTSGRLSIVPLQATILGSQIRQAAMLKEGFLDLFIEDMPAFRDLAPSLDLLSLPYIFRDLNHQQSFFNSAVFDQDVKTQLLRQGVYPVNTRWNWKRGLEWVILATHPITRPEQVRGLKVRVFESPMLVRFWEEMGAVPVVIPWPHVKKAWLRGEIDLLPTHKAHLFPLGFCQRGRFVTLLGDVAPLLMVAVNQNRYRCLPPGAQNALVEACNAAGDFFSEEVVRAEAEMKRQTCAGMALSI